MPRFELDEQHIAARIAALDPMTASIPAGNSYNKSYPDMCALFQGVAITPRPLVQGAHMVYGWMPTILELDRRELQAVVADLNALQGIDDRELTKDAWIRLRKVVNNSLVGASKLGHFVAPSRVAIWDSRIIEHLVTGVAKTTAAALQSRAGQLEGFLAYQRAMRNARNSVHAMQFNQVVSQQLGYRVSDLRAIELLMFHG